jgi:hypothetical protein
VPLQAILNEFVLKKLKMGSKQQQPPVKEDDEFQEFHLAGKL